MIDIITLHSPMHMLFSTPIAYIDGGSGSLILQAAISGLLGSIFVIKSYWKNFKLKNSQRCNLEVVSTNDELSKAA